jgi:DNA invertase Pin-like site-specific DNA recombinase
MRDLYRGAEFLKILMVLIGAAVIDRFRKGVRRSKRHAIDRDRVRAMHVEGMGAAEIARALGIGRSSVYRILNGEEGN